MKTCSQIRKETWALLKTKWFGRILVVGLILAGISAIVHYLIVGAFGTLSIDTVSDYLQRKEQASRAGLCYTLPTTRAYVWMIVGELFQTFIAYIFAAIMVYGVARVMLKAEANDERRWFADSFEGFSRPFEMMGTLLLVNVKALLWTLLLVFPGFIAVYRYRQTWFLKIEHPDWTASACIAESGRLMKGRKLQAFWLDLTYLLLVMGVIFCINLLAILSVATLSTKGAFGLVLGSIGSLCSFFGFYLLVKICAAIAVSRVIFYRATLAAKAEQANTPPAA
jgi:uncharacterized membrane protein